jgi:hypothetical protein
MRFLSRKFILACFFALAGTGLAATGKLSADFVGLAALILGAYGYANIKAKEVDPGD